MNHPPKSRTNSTLCLPSHCRPVPPSELADLSGGVGLSWWDFADALFGGFYVSVNIGWSGAKLAKITDIILPSLSGIVKEIRVYFNVKLWGY